MTRNSHAALLAEWDRLLRVVRNNEAELDGIAPLLATLERAYALAMSTLVRRNALRAASGEATRQMNEAFQACRDASISLRCSVKGTLGPRNERLVLYGVKPIRKRRRGRQVGGACGLPS